MFWAIVQGLIAGKRRAGLLRGNRLSSSVCLRFSRLFCHDGIVG